MSAAFKLIVLSLDSIALLLLGLKFILPLALSH